MKKAFWLAGATVLALAQPAFAGDTIKIGFVSTFSGPTAVIGNDMGVTLSGGEQQMLAIGRALMTNPKLLILDEATEGLAPLIREEIWNCLSMLKGRGQSVLVIDKNVANLSRIADRHYIIERGRTVWSGTSEQLIAEPDLQHRYLGI